MKPFTTTGLMILFALSLCAGGTRAASSEQDALSTRRGLAGVEGRLGEKEASSGERRTQADILASAPMLERAVDPESYVLGPYDELVVSLMGPEPRTYSLAVLPEGVVLVPEVGPVRADGLTIGEFRRALEAAMKTYFRNIELYCYLASPAAFRVFVTGEVENPGAVAVSGVERVADAIEKAGSVKSFGSLRLITLERGAETIRIDLFRFVARGDLANNPFLRSGDRIHVPPLGSRATLSGQVKKPGVYEILEGETVADLIELGGGFTSDAIEDSVLVSERAAGSAARPSSGTVPAAQFARRLKDGDEVAVFDRLKGLLTVRVEGATNRTGRFVLAPGDGIAELVVRAGGFRDQADLSSAYVSRKTGEIVKANLNEYLLPDPAKRFALVDGDLLTIPELRRTVTVGGEVNEPGEFEYRGDLTVIQYIGLAGGPSKDGSVNRVVIYSPDGSSRPGHRDSRLNRGDVVIVKKSGFKIFGSLFDGILRIGTVVVSILILNK